MLMKETHKLGLHFATCSYICVTMSWIIWIYGTAKFWIEVWIEVDCNQWWLHAYKNSFLIKVYLHLCEEESRIPYVFCSFLINALLLKNKTNNKTKNQTNSSLHFMTGWQWDHRKIVLKILLCEKMWHRPYWFARKVKKLQILVQNFVGILQINNNNQA